MPLDGVVRLLEYVSGEEIERREHPPGSGNMQVNQFELIGAIKRVQPIIKAELIDFATISFPEDEFRQALPDGKAAVIETYIRDSTEVLGEYHNLSSVRQRFVDLPRGNKWETKR